VDKVKLGAVAVRTLIELIDYPDTPPSIKMIPVKLIERGSTKTRKKNGGKGNE
jgi:DNA-binding LacI/PurR family transcriptional regulator